MENRLEITNRNITATLRNVLTVSESTVKAFVTVFLCASILGIATGMPTASVLVTFAVTVAALLTVFFRRRVTADCALGQRKEKL